VLGFFFVVKPWINFDLFHMSFQWFTHMLASNVFTCIPLSPPIRLLFPSSSSKWKKHRSISSSLTCFYFFKSIYLALDSCFSQSSKSCVLNKSPPIILLVFLLSLTCKFCFPPSYFFLFNLLFATFYYMHDYDSRKANQTISHSQTTFNCWGQLLLQQ
jgi:hypothetical protein